MHGYWKFPTRVGTCSIRPIDGRWHAMLNDESLGSYASARAAHSDLVGGHTFTPSSGIDTASLGLPDDLDAWEFVRAH